eukprot:365205-Chlamydomonas_euryale.AAC.18
MSTAGRPIYRHTMECHTFPCTLQRMLPCTLWVHFACTLQTRTCKCRRGCHPGLHSCTLCWRLLQEGWAMHSAAGRGGKRCARSTRGFSLCAMSSTISRVVAKLRL